MTKANNSSGRLLSRATQILFPVLITMLLAATTEAAAPMFHGSDPLTRRDRLQTPGSRSSGPQAPRPQS